jgi:hypothetical protein
MFLKFEMKILFWNLKNIWSYNQGEMKTFEKNIFEI